MYIIIKNSEYDNTEEYQIDAVHKPDDAKENEVNNEDADYPLKFRLSSKHFKNRINNIKQISKTVIIEKKGNDPLQITFDKERKIDGAGIYPNSDKIDLKWTLGDNAILRVAVPIDYIKPFSDSNIGEQVHIAVHIHDKLSLTTFLDQVGVDEWICCVKVSTEIKNHGAGLIQ